MCFNSTMIDSHGCVHAWSYIQPVQPPHYIADEVPEMMRTMALAFYDPLYQHTSSMPVINPGLPAYLPADDDEDALCNYMSHMDNPHEFAYDSEYVLTSRIARQERRRQLRNARKKESISACCLMSNRICTLKELIGSSTKGNKLTDLQKTQLDAVLYRCSDAFAANSNDVGREHHFDIAYNKGVENTVADALPTLTTWPCGRRYGASCLSML
ncbi:hypothetical protein WJX74_009209 [Apatococcus lobatus]|uniref:BZIP domain-containing protein n=1 Tax=Apatococcus lobatus TaxID=904363 RepID=A0AAW1S3I7_9CHLO